MSTEAYRFAGYGLEVTVSGDWEEVIEAVRRDFAWFERSAADTDESFSLRIERRPPDYDSLGDVPAAVITERSVVFHVGRRIAVDYLGEALSLYDPERAEAIVQGEEENMARRAAFDILLARFAGSAERHGLTRVTGLGLAGRQGALLLKLPPGGGKTTLALRALREPGVTFLSETGPLLDRHGRLHPLPLPLWVRDRAPEIDSLPAEFLRMQGRRRTDPVILELEAFAGRIEQSSRPLRHIVLGRRSLGRESRLEPLSRRAGLTALARDAVMGFSFAVGLEFFRRHGLWQIVGSPRAAAGRAYAIGVGFRHAEVWQLTLGRDREGNWQALEPLLR